MGARFFDSQAQLLVSKPSFLRTGMLFEFSLS